MRKTVTNLMDIANLFYGMYFRPLPLDDMFDFAFSTYQSESKTKKRFSQLIADCKRLEKSMSKVTGSHRILYDNSRCDGRTVFLYVAHWQRWFIYHSLLQKDIEYCMQFIYDHTAVLEFVLNDISNLFYTVGLCAIDRAVGVSRAFFDHDNIKYCYNFDNSLNVLTVMKYILLTRGQWNVKYAVRYEGYKRRLFRYVVSEIITADQVRKYTDDIFKDYEHCVLEYDVAHELLRKGARVLRGQNADMTEYMDNMLRIERIMYEMGEVRWNRMVFHNLPCSGTLFFFADPSFYRYYYKTRDELKQAAMMFWDRFGGIRNEGACVDHAEARYLAIMSDKFPAYDDRLPLERDIQYSARSLYACVNIDEFIDFDYEARIEKFLLKLYPSINVYPDSSDALYFKKLVICQFKSYVILSKVKDGWKDTLLQLKHYEKIFDTKFDKDNFVDFWQRYFKDNNVWDEDLDAVFSVVLSVWYDIC